MPSGIVYTLNTEGVLLPSLVWRNLWPPVSSRAMDWGSKEEKIMERESVARSLTCALMENKLNDSQPAKRVWPGKGSSKFIFGGKSREKGYQ